MYIGTSCYRCVLRTHSIAHAWRQQLVGIVFGTSCYNCIEVSFDNCNNARAARTDGSASKLRADND